GCPFRCTFCVHDRHPMPYRTRPVADVMNELDHFHSHYDFNILVILDELFAAKRTRLVEFSQAIQKLRHDRGWDLKWTFQTHANAGFTQEEIAMARDAGCYLFVYGVESASETVLASMRKRTHPKQIADVIPMCYKARVGFAANFIFGDPAETPQTVKETMTFFRDHCENTHTGLGSIQPYPGSALYANCLQNKTIPDAGQFYESIDERRYCMTPGFPEKPWMLWSALLGFLGAKGLWHQVAPAVVHSRETSANFDTLVLVAKCPHCGVQFTYRHSEVPQHTTETTMFFGQTKLLSWVPKVKHHRLFAWLVLKAAALISLLYPWFTYLKYTVRPGSQTNNTIATGCPECNQCVSLNW
ncbi:MAG: radical SAM protein, partial [Verrucomicrobiota bacterium]